MVVVLFVLVLVYGVLCFSSVFFGELCDVLFGWVVEWVLLFMGLEVFNYFYCFDLEYYFICKIGGLLWDIDWGISVVLFLMWVLVFSVILILVEVVMVIGVFVWYFDLFFVWIILVVVVIYIFFLVIVIEWRMEYVRIVNQKDSLVNICVIDSLLNYEIVKYFNNEVFEVDSYFCYL